MGDIITKHTVKIQLTAAISVILAVVMWTSYGVRYMAKVEANAEAILEIKPQVVKIPIIEANVDIIKEDISEIKGDIKTLLKQR